MALLPAFFCSDKAATMSSHQPKTDQKIQQSSPTPKVAAVPCVVLAVFVAASSDRLKLEAYEFSVWQNGTGIFTEARVVLSL